MSEQYEGEDLFPEDFTIPDDADPPTAASVNPAFEGLGDRTQYLRNRMFTTLISTVISTGTVTAPTGAILAMLEGCGGGGGGAAGANMGGASCRASGGGGGGAAVRRVELVPVVAGRDYDVSIGAGGIGGPNDYDVGLESYIPTDGGVGGNTQFQDSVTEAILAVFAGAGGGLKGTVTIGTSTYGFGVGGSPVRGAAVTGSPVSPAVSAATSTNADVHPQPSTPYAGAPGLTGNNLRSNAQGANSPEYYGGGATGIGNSTIDGTQYGGGGGGGGGGGAYGDGGVGGIGGAPNNSGLGGDGAAGTAATVNTGGGGGGGGGGGAGSTGGGIAGAGGDGGAGRLVIRWLCRGTP